jgi:hypothetical protein
MGDEYITEDPPSQSFGGQVGGTEEIEETEEEEESGNRGNR